MSQPLRTRLELIHAGLTADRTYRAYAFALLSVRTRLEKHEEAFNLLMDLAPTLEELRRASPAALRLAVRGCNYPTQKANALLAAREVLGRAFGILRATSTGQEAREALVALLPGLGYTKVSFMLMLVGRLDVACIDVHMCHLLKADPERVRTPGQYLKAEAKLRRLAFKAGLPVGLFQWVRWMELMGDRATGHDHYFDAQDQ